MTTVHPHPHAEFDRYPALLCDLEQQLGRDGIIAIAERIIDAERADFHWDGRIAERNLGPFESFDEDETFERVAIIGYFHGRYYVAICIVDDDRCVHWMTKLRRFENFESAESAFRTNE
jgi:hypothetical protein